mmetsp:Transcript_28411/g.64412  ORF Transcript_28411/g.64412 Transcript_28411/m.64412 type:complete len:384 (-) Transcript_28411:105-1256(-)
MFIKGYDLTYFCSSWTIKHTAATILASSVFFSLALVLSPIFLGYALPKCASPTLPCRIDAAGCLCSIMSADNSCWQRLPQALRCYKSTMSVSSGSCKGNYETKLCAESQLEADLALEALAQGTTELNPFSEGLCNATYNLENDRCSLPNTRFGASAFEYLQCCRSPVATCVNDNDCCNCGLESAKCKTNLRCFVTSKGLNGTVESSQDCLSTDDACIWFQYQGCDNNAANCDSTTKAVNVNNPKDSACCANQTCVDQTTLEISTLESSINDLSVQYDIAVNDGLNTVNSLAEQLAAARARLEEDLRTINCRSQCQAGNDLVGCPCIDQTAGCFRKMCVTTSAYFKYGGVEAYLTSLGAINTRICYTNDCNQGQFQEWAAREEL